MAAAIVSMRTSATASYQTACTNKWQTLLAFTSTSSRAKGLSCVQMQGSFGKVYRGKLSGRTLAVKVRRCPAAIQIT